VTTDCLLSLNLPQYEILLLTDAVMLYHQHLYALSQFGTVREHGYHTHQVSLLTACDSRAITLFQTVTTDCSLSLNSPLHEIL
jgi:hypothetical protein